MARRAEAVGVAKAKQPAVRMFVLALLGGAFIAFGALFSVVATTPGPDSTLPYGVGQVLAGVVFSLGLVLVVVAGAELFTGNNLGVMAWASRRVRTRALLRGWVIVYVGNVVAAFAIAYVVHLSGAFDNGGGAVGERTIAVATAKTSRPFGQELILGVLGNVLVCLAVWLSFAARSVTDKVLAIVLPVSAFVAAGFEHSIANAYLVPAGLLAEGGGDGPLTWSRFVTHNLVPVTIGNLIGGAVLVGIVYWFVYLRPGADLTPTRAGPT
jgi:formate/nitrite transporter